MDKPRDDTAIRVQAQQATLFALLKSGIPTAGAETAWKALTEATARTLGVRRASIWLLDAERSHLRLQDLYDLATNRHAKGVELDARQYPAYFQALRWNRAIVAPDAAADPRTSEFAVGYLDKHDIVSMLDAGIWQAGEARGVVCLESVEERRDWTADEQQFTGSIADLAASVLDHEALRAARVRLEESEALFSRALWASPDWISVVRLSDGVILSLNEAFERESGYRISDLIGRTNAGAGIWAKPEQRAAWIERVRQEGLVRDHEVEFRTKAGETRIFQLSGHRVEIRGEECVVTNSRDITERKRKERLLQDIARGVGAEIGESFFRSLVDHLAAALQADSALIGEIDPARPAVVRTIAANKGGQPRPDFEYPLEGTPCETVIGRRSVCSYADGFSRKFPAEKDVEAYVGAALNDSQGRALGLIAVTFRRPLAEVTLAESLLTIYAARAAAEIERRRHLQSLEHQARHDPLTGLPNRVLLREMVEADMPRIAGGGQRGALLLADLDRFKEINDTLGHHVGDALLNRLSRRLETEMAAMDGARVARLGGDEFAIWAARLAGEGAEEGVAARALASLVAPIEVEGYRLEVGASIGIAIAPTDAVSAGGLLRCADVAMYRAKSQGAGYMAYEPAQDPYSEERLALLSELGSAVRRGEMEVFYQPRLELAHRTVSGFEALVRWRHPRLGLLAPARFIPLAELSDVIRPLTLWVLGTALAQQRKWGSNARMSVNFSARHLLDDGCPEQIGRILAENGADPTALELEITESALIADPERARGTLERIRALGVRIAIDDFGTGYSSLSHLKRLPLHALKIDVSFVRQMLASPADRVIVDTTIGLAHQLGLSVAAEGIEDEATLAALRAQGCDEGQGFLFAPPMDAAAAERWMRANVH